jgi:chitinase
MVDINPDMPEENYQFTPIGRVTGIVGAEGAVTTMVVALQADGFSRSDVEVFCGAEGARKLHTRGEQSTSAGLFRLVESWVSDTADFQHQADAALRSGGYVIAVEVGTDEHRKNRVMDVLKEHGAADVKYWHSLYTEDATRGQ